MFWTWSFVQHRVMICFDHKAEDQSGFVLYLVFVYLEFQTKMNMYQS